MSPFDESPPTWLREIAKPVNGEKLGETLGVSLMSMATAFERDPNAAPDAGYLDSRKGINQGWYETQQNQRDPEWRVKGQILANKVLEQKAQLTAAAAVANEQTKETSAWMEDAPNLTPWITATPEQRRTMNTPTAKSKLGLTTLQKQSIADQTYFTKQDQMDNRLEQERLKADHSAGITARVQDWNDAVAAASPDVFSQIEALGPKGRLPSGLPTPQAIALLNTDREAKGMVAYGTKAAEYLNKPGRFTPEQTDRLRELNTQETDLIRQIGKAQTPEEKDSLRSELKAIQATRKAVREGKEPTADTVAPDPMAGKIDAAQKELNHALATGKDVKVKTEALATLKYEQALNNGYDVLKKGQEVDPSTAKIGSIFFIESTGKTKYIKTKFQLDEFLKQFGPGSKQGGSTSSAPAPRAVIPGIASPESAFPSSTTQTGKGAGGAQRAAQTYAANKKDRIAELTSLLNNAKKPGHTLTRQEYVAKYDELAKLMAE